MYPKQQAIGLASHTRIHSVLMFRFPTVPGLQPHRLSTFQTYAEQVSFEDESRADTRVLIQALTDIEHPSSWPQAHFDQQLALPDTIALPSVRHSKHRDLQGGGTNSSAQVAGKQPVSKSLDFGQGDLSDKMKEVWRVPGDTLNKAGNQIRLLTTGVSGQHVPKLGVAESTQNSQWNS